MSKSRRLNIGSSRPEQDTYSELIKSPRQAAVEAAEHERRSQEKAAPATTSAAASGAPPEMALEEIQAVPKEQRRPTNFALPKQLDLHRRMTLYKIDAGVQIQDQITVAIDRWLREQGY